MIGFDLDDTVYIPAGARARAVQPRQPVRDPRAVRGDAPVDEVVEGIRSVLVARHGDEDFTITTQQQMLDTLGSVLDVLTFAVAALGSISLLVGAVGIFTIMTIAVRERTGEIGLLRALGASRDQVLSLFLAEAVLLSLLGGLAGLAVGAGVAWLLGVVGAAACRSASRRCSWGCRARPVDRDRAGRRHPARAQRRAARPGRGAAGGVTGSAAGRPHAARGDGLVRIVGPVVLRVAALQLLLHLVVAARPEAREVARHLHRPARRRQQFERDRHACRRRRAATPSARTLPAAARRASARRSSSRWRCASRSARRGASAPARRGAAARSSRAGRAARRAGRAARADRGA